MGLNPDLLSIVRHYCNVVQNNRTADDIFDAYSDEAVELLQAYDYSMQGIVEEDGVIGESIDVIICLLDLIFKTAPDITNEDIVAYAEKKCQKWQRLYSLTDYSVKE
jgi:hypothetical protein